MSYVAHMYLSPSYPDVRVWSLTSLGLVSISSFFRALLHSFSIAFDPTKLFGNLKFPLKLRLLYDLWLVRGLIPMICSRSGGPSRLLIQSGALCARRVGNQLIIFSFTIRQLWTYGLDYLTLWEWIGCHHVQWWR